MFALLLFFAACTIATPDCAERVPVGKQGNYTVVYRTHSLENTNPAITRAFVLVHGQGRNADDYFRTAAAAGFLAGALEDALIVSPRLASNQGNCKDVLGEGEINQPCSGQSWRGGAPALNSEEATSFHFMDELLRRVASRQRFPNLKFITLAGHSAGGQFVHRYAAASRVLDELGVPVRLVVSNPSSYLCLDVRRPDAEGKLVEFPGAASCPQFNRYLYGMEQRTGYSAGIPDAQMKENLIRRRVIYLLGELDTEPLAGFDSSCPAMAQGRNRLERGRHYWKSINGDFGAKHELVIAPMCGHNARCVFTTDAALKTVFQP